jgi:hypothetical protein
MKRLIGATALAILGLSYSAQAAVEPDPVEEPVAAVEPEIVVWTGDVKDHIDYGEVVETPSAPVRSCVSGFVNRVPC